MLRVCYGIFGGEENNNSIRSLIYGAQRRNRTTDTKIFDRFNVRASGANLAPVNID